MNCRTAINQSSPEASVLKKKNYIIHKDDQRNESIRSNALNYIRMLPLTRSIEITIQPYHKDLTKEQRGWFHQLCKILGDEIGYPLGTIKEVVKENVYGKTVVKVGNREYLVVESSEHDADGNKRKTIDYADLIEGAYQLGAEAGIVLPNPDPRLRKSA